MLSTEVCQGRGSLLSRSQAVAIFMGLNSLLGNALGGPGDWLTYLVPALGLIEISFQL